MEELPGLILKEVGFNSTIFQNLNKEIKLINACKLSLKSMIFKEKMDFPPGDIWISVKGLVACDNVDFKWTKRWDISSCLINLGNEGFKFGGSLKEIGIEIDVKENKNFYRILIFYENLMTK